jgi:hypothetical protein
MQHAIADNPEAAAEEKHEKARTGMAKIRATNVIRGRNGSFPRESKDYRLAKIKGAAGAAAYIIGINQRDI